MDIELRRIEFVGPQVGEELRDDGGIAMLTALGLVMLYVAFRFQIKFALGAVIALAHDVIFTRLFLADRPRVRPDGSGGSVGGGGVFAERYDRGIGPYSREFTQDSARQSGEVIDVSLTETLGRTLVTSLTTLLVLAALALFGGEMIFGFAVALLVGVAVGTYSSMYVAATTLLQLGVNKEDVMVPEREGADQDGLIP